MASLPTLADIKAALGIDADDDTKDAAIESLLEATIAIVESYLGRGIQSAPMVQDFDPPDNRDPSLLLFRFPVSQVNSITQAGVTLTGWRLYKTPGIVQWKFGRCAIHYTCCGEEPMPVTVDYIGGFADDAWPADLAEAVMRAFYFRWAATGNTGNVADIVNTPGINRSVSVDGLTVTRDSAMYAGKAFEDQAVPPELVSVAPMLEPYRSRIVTGV